MDQDKIISGGRWITPTTLTTRGLGLITTVLLTKFIPPEEFGLYALGIREESMKTKYPYGWT
jgi:O-antigen/teichoic acid export membrane protein